MRDVETQSPEEIERRIEETRQQMSQTLEALQERLAPGDLMEEAWKYVRGSGADVGKGLIETVRENPVPTLLIGIGLSWLVVGGSVSRSRSQGPYGYYQGYDGRDYDTDLGYEGGTPGTYAGDSHRSGLADKARQTWQGAKEKISETAAKVKGRTSEMAERISDRGQDTGDSMHTQGQSKSAQLNEKYQQAAHRSQEVYQHSMDRAAELGHNAKARYSEQKRRARQTVQTVIEDHPLAVVAIGVGVGAFIGAMLPTSRQEQQLLGDTGAQLRDTVMSAGREQVDRAREAVERTAHAVREQAEKQRSHEDESLGEKASRMAGAARQEMKNESQRDDKLGTSPTSSESRKSITPPV